MQGSSNLASFDKAARSRDRRLKVPRPRMNRRGLLLMEARLHRSRRSPRQEAARLRDAERLSSTIISMRHEDGQLARSQHAARRSAEDQLAQPPMAIGAHHDEVGAALGRA